MKKLLYSGLVLLAMQSCLGNDDDDNGDNKTEVQAQQEVLLTAEKWELTEAIVDVDMTIRIMGEEIPWDSYQEFTEVEFGCQNDALFQFVDGGTIAVEKLETYCPANEMDVSEYRWRMNGEATVLTIKGDMAAGAITTAEGTTSLGDEADYVITSLTNEELVLTRTMDAREIMGAEAEVYESIGGSITGTAQTIITYRAN